jgi:localization factor PodJL
MTGAPWSVKGIDPKTREIAKDLARRSGMTLGEWLTHVIAEDGAEGLVVGPARKAGDRPASENRTPRRGGDDLERVLEALQDLSARFEASVEEQAETAARFDRAIAELKDDQARVAERLQAAEQGGGGGGKVETLRALEGALNKVAGHLAAGEGRQREALAEMRRELGEEMSRVAEQVNRKVLEVENRGADAIAQVGAEVTRVANAVEQRLRRADDSQAEALEKLGAEIARITERLSERIAAAERRSAQSVEDVGQQVARMADRMHARQERNESELAERIRQSEERTARLLEEARQTIDRRLLRSAGPAAEDAPRSSAFSERWTPVETPVAEAAEAEAETMEAGFAEPEAFFEREVPEAEIAESEVLAVDAELIEEEGADAESILEASSYDGLTTEAGEEPYADLDEDDHPEKPGTIGFQSYAPTLTADPGFHAEDDLEAMQAVADAIAAVQGEQDEDEPAPAQAEAEEPEESLRPSTRDLIAQAKAQAFADPDAFGQAYGAAGAAAHDDEEEEHEAPTFIDLGARKPRSANTMRGAILAGGAAAFMGLAGAGYVALMHPEIAPGLGGPGAKPIPVGPPSAPTPAAAQQAAVALATSPAPQSNAGQAGSETSDGQDLESLYRDAVAKVDAGDASGVTPLRTAANLGYAPAQRRLGKLYEDGGAGVAKDPVEGRRWTIRAAANGDARGMHNLGLDYYQGVGGPKNYTVAAQYFQRAAELGLRDSQYNIARFYEAGIGVQRDLGAAYRWYLIAGRAGDTEAAARAEALKPRLTPAERTSAEALAGAFRADPSAPPASLTASLRGANPKQLALAQRALGKLGYYKGAADGQASEALGEAIQSYQRERGLAENGQLSPELVQTFAHIAQ